MWGMENASVQDKKQQNQEVEQHIKHFSQKVERFLSQSQRI